MTLTVREYWISQLAKVATPPLEFLAKKSKTATMPIETRPGHSDRKKYAHLEVLGRTLAGIAPWLELMPNQAEAATHRHIHALSLEAVTQAVKTGSPNLLNFTEGNQSLVDAAFLAHALLRAPNALWNALDGRAKEELLSALLSTRSITPAFNNWLLFSAIVEAAALRFTGSADLTRIEYAVHQHEQWYKGDGVYGDGPDFHWDYYNSFVIQPMLIDIVDIAAAASPGWPNTCGKSN